MIMQWKFYKVYEGYIEFDTLENMQQDKKLVPQKIGKKCRLV